jgi:hypothetical protein
MDGEAKPHTVQPFHLMDLGFITSSAIPPRRTMIPTTGGMKCDSLVSTCIPRKSMDSPGVVNEMPE